MFPVFFGSQLSSEIATIFLIKYWKRPDLNPGPARGNYLWEQRQFLEKLLETPGFEPRGSLARTVQLRSAKLF